MSSFETVYPPTPQNVPESVTRVSPAFKKVVSGVLGSIVLFFIVYILLFALSIVLIIACVYGGIALIVAAPKLLVILIGLGLIGVGVMVFIFLIKFLFAVSRVDHSNSIEITEEEQPRLFGFIRQLTQEVQTPFPKKIVVSPDVNAAVFYNSSFWSMFLPVKKNLQIGLGLVNSLNVSEFKAVMAHEFGHFSQRSMKLGSFVYNVNRIIHNMLFENTSYSSFLQGWASIDGVFALFAQITAKIAQCIQWILRQMYGVINKSYMRLSREMEFHADAVAASVSGSRSLVTALRRIELANTGYNIALQKCDELFHQKKISDNIYANHSTILKHMATEFKLPLEHGIPVVNDQFLEENRKSRVNFKDQWASHPSTEDREQHLNSLAVPAIVMIESAWVLFDNPEELQSRLTQKVYENAPRDKDTITIGNNEFEENLRKDVYGLTFPDAYNGYYDNRLIAVNETPVLSSATENGEMTFDRMFTAENAALPKKITAIENDLLLLKAIHEKNILAKTFDFDGVKYQSKEAPAVIAVLEGEKQKHQDALERMDRKAMHFFFTKARNKSQEEGAELEKLYTQYFADRRKSDELLTHINNMMEVFQSLVPDYVNEMIGRLKGTHEQRFREDLAYWTERGVFKHYAVQQEIDDFIKSNFTYMPGTSSFHSDTIALRTVCENAWKAVNAYIFVEFKTILEKQLEFVKN
jgi:Zn-dependent protease with chaperone function